MDAENIFKEKLLYFVISFTYLGILPKNIKCVEPVTR